MKRTSFSILFFIKKTRLNKSGEAPISLRITLNSMRAETTIKRNVDPKKWNSKKERVVGNDPKSHELNLYMETIRSKILGVFRILEADNKPITAQKLLQHYCGINEGPKMLLAEFTKHNLKCEELINKEYAEGTVRRFKRTVRYLSEYIKQKYKLNDIPFKDVDHVFITDFEHFIKINKECGHNTVIQYLKSLKKIIRYALSSSWINIDPYMNIKLQHEQTNRESLLAEEVNRIIEKEFTIERLATIRDIFIFCCFTGLAFTDVKHLKYTHISKDDQGEYWIRKPREKTNNLCRIPLLEIPRQIMEKYRTHPSCKEKNVVLPVPSNQRMNSYLKEIADACGIDKNLTTHIARHINFIPHCK